MLDAREVDHRLAQEPGGRDDRPAYLVLTPGSEVESLRRTRGPDHDPP
jgi:hypothetical protein